MADIIRFNVTTKGTSSDNGFDGTRFGLVATNNIEHALFTTPAAADWDNQELADLYRVRDLLAKAGGHIEVDRGVSDEGDPWFVFCQPDGEVFVHLCRIDGIYLLDSPNMASHLTGPDFRTLINAFVNRATGQHAAMNSKIVPFHPKNGVYLHPAMLLTALIWSLYIASDDLVGLAPAENTDFGAVELNSVLGPKIIDQEAIAPIIEAFHNSDRQNDNSDTDAQAYPSAAADTRNASSVTQNAATAPALAMSLTTLAVAYGLLSQSSFEIASASLEDNSSTIQIENTQFLLPEHVAATDEEIVVRAADDDDTAQEVEAAQTITVDVVNLPTGAVASDVKILDLTPIVTEIIGPDVLFALAAPDQATTVALTTPHAEKTATDNSAEQSTEDTSTVSTVIHDFGALLGLDAAAIQDLASYTVADLNVVASFDIGSTDGQHILYNLKTSSVEINSTILDIIPLTSALEEPTAPTEETISNLHPTLDRYSEQTKKFIDFLLQKGDAIKIVAAANEIIFLDITAFDDATDVYHTQSWTFEDGGVISTIGHLHEFVEFGLV